MFLINSVPARSARLASPWLAALLAMPGLPAGADEAGAELARRLLAEGAIAPLAHFVERARALRGGVLLDAKLHYEASHAQYVYELHMLDAQGAVWELEFDARDGELIEHEPYGHDDAPAADR